MRLLSTQTRVRKLWFYLEPADALAFGISIPIVTVVPLLLAAVGVVGSAPQENTLKGLFQGIIGDMKHAVTDVRYTFESLINAEPVTGFYSPDALRAFDNALASGALSRHAAYPTGLLDLTGPTISTLDGQAFAVRQESLLNALSGPSLAAYQPRIQQLIQGDHATWAARGGTFSLALQAKTTTFKVFLAVVYGVTQPDMYLGYRAQRDEYLEYAKKTLSRAPSDAIKIRERLLATLVRPAIAASHARIRVGAAPSCVLDALVAQNTMSDSDLVSEVFQLMAMGVPGLEGLVVHTITAMVGVDGVRGQLGSARNAYVSKYPDGAHWQHLDDLDVVNAYVSEVQRAYNVSPRHTFARATKDFVVANSSSVPKHRLTVALLDCLNHNAAQWSSPAQFQVARFAGTNPSAYEFAPFALNDLVDRRAGRRETLSRLILQTHVVSLLNFAAVMAPLQSYALDDGPNTLPVDLLTTVGFHYAPGVVHSSNTDGDAWRRLRQPSAKLYNSSIESPLSSDKRLDFLTHSMIQLLNVRFATWVAPTAAASLTVPKSQKPLAKQTLHSMSIQIPVDDEDVSIPKVLLDGAKLLQDTAPFVDNFDDSWVPGEDMEGYVLSKVGRVWPRVRVHWDDRYSDRTLELFVFNGLGQHMVTKLPAAHNDGSYYTVTTCFLETLDVRPGYAVTGADAYFDKTVKSSRSSDLARRFGPPMRSGSTLRCAFARALPTRSRLSITVGNYMTTASREQLPPTHPLRRLIKPFTFRAIAINYEASKLLFAPKGILHRAHPYSEKCLKDTWAMALQSLKLEPFPEHIARQNIDTLKLPFHEDGLDFWKIVHGFTSEYLALYYKNDDDVTRDASIQSFWTFLNKQLPTPLGALSLERLKDVVAHGIFLVTAMHNHPGGIVEYISDPAFCPVSWVEGELAGRPGTAVRTALIMSGTGYPQPSILEDFSHVFLNDAAKAVAHRFTASLQSFVKVVETRNAKRMLPYQGFNPAVMDMAIGI